ncbi:MAG: nitroreductase family protein [Muribaculaceae bacterium]|nr:nitroreductase family protein [Muribaculaceae bacterium]
MQYDLDTLRERHSVRKYSDRAVPAAEIGQLRDLVAELNRTYKGVRFSLVVNDGETFNSFKRTYGMISGVKNYLVAVADTTVADSEEIAGFCGEAFVMAATAMGLGTCFVGATYNPATVKIILSASEEIAFLVPFGYENEDGPGFLGKLVSKITHRKSILPEDFYDNSLGFFNLQEALERMPALRDALEALAAAPSGMNKQPARIWMGEDTMLHLGVAFKGDYTSIDLGIAKFNVQAVIPGKWEWGAGGALLSEA